MRKRTVRRQRADFKQAFGDLETTPAIVEQRTYTADEIDAMLIGRADKALLRRQLQLRKMQERVREVLLSESSEVQP